MELSDDEHAAALTVFLLDSVCPANTGQLTAVKMLMLDGSGPEHVSRVIGKLAAASKPILCTAYRAPTGHLVLNSQQVTGADEDADWRARTAAEIEGHGFFGDLFHEYDHTSGSLIEISTNTGTRMQVPLTGLRCWRRDFLVPAITQFEGSRPDHAARSAGVVYKVHASGPLVQSQHFRRP